MIARQILDRIVDKRRKRKKQEKGGNKQLMTIDRKRDLFANIARETLVHGWLEGEIWWI